MVATSQRASLIATGRTQRPKATHRPPRSGYPLLRRKGPQSRGKQKESTRANADTQRRIGRQAEQLIDAHRRRQRLVDAAARIDALALFVARRQCRDRRFGPARWYQIVCIARP
jgi:hypothetical protein